MWPRRPLIPNCHNWTPPLNYQGGHFYQNMHIMIINATCEVAGGVDLCVFGCFKFTFHSTHGSIGISETARLSV